MIAAVQGLYPNVDSILTLRAFDKNVSSGRSRLLCCCLLPVVVLTSVLRNFQYVWLASARTSQLEFVSTLLYSVILRLTDSSSIFVFHYFGFWRLYSLLCDLIRYCSSYDMRFLAALIYLLPVLSYHPVPVQHFWNRIYTAAVQQHTKFARQSSTTFSVPAHLTRMYHIIHHFVLRISCHTPWWYTSSAHRLCGSR